MNQKLNPRYTCDITPKRVTSGGAHYRGLVLRKTAPKKKKMQRWQTFGDTSWLAQLLSSLPSVKLIAHCLEINGWIPGPVKLDIMRI